MIWFTIAMFFVSFLVTALLAPEPEIENARAGSLDDVQFPRATEDAPIPFVVGRVRMNAPNTMWYGDWSTAPITERIKVSMFKKKTIIVGHRYYMGMDLGLCLGENVSMREVWLDETRVWQGDTGGAAAYSGSISATSLFGGHKKGGGWSGDFTFYSGTFPQAIDSYIEGVVGAGDVPGYAGISHLVFENNYIGESNSLRRMAFTLERYTNDLGSINSGRVGDYDVNPMECLYQVMANDWGGLGVNVGDIDTANWITVAEQLYNEGNGMSIIVTAAQSGKQIVTEIMRQIDGIMYQDPTTGKLQVKLIRMDYVVDDLDIYDEDDIVKMRSFTKTAWEDVISQVKVSFPQRDKESSAVAISMDGATSTMLGRLKTTTMSFPFCYDPTLANTIASRERAQASIPLFRMTIEMTRNAWRIKPGDVFKISWPEYGFTELVLRAQKHDLGALLDNRIVLDCVQDSFAVGSTVFANPATSGWVAPVTQPSPVETWIQTDAPAFFGRVLESPVQEGYSQPMTIPLRPAATSSTFSVLGGNATGELDVLELDEIGYPATGVLQDDYSRSAGQVTGVDATGFTLLSRQGEFFEGVDEADLLAGQAGLLYVDGEWMGFLGVTNDPTEAVVTNVYRGLFGSPVKSHAAGTRVYQIESDLFGTGDQGIDLAHDSTFYYKILDAVGARRAAPEGLTEETFNPTDVMRVPLRPRGLDAAGSRAVFDKTDTTDLVLTWKHTDRETVVTYPGELAATETPAETTTYDVEVWIDGVKDASLSTTEVAALTWSVPFSTVTPPLVSDDCEIRVYSRIDNPDSPGVGTDYLSQGYASLSFTCNIRDNRLLTSGDMQSGSDAILVEGDQVSGTTYRLSLEGDEA